MDNLLQAINDYYHAEGHYPKVKVSPAFRDKHIFNQDLRGREMDGIKIVTDETVDQWELE